MKNPLNKRLPRELKSEIGKYLVLFLFLAGMISIVSGFLVANRSMIITYDESFDKYNIEDGNFELYAQANDALLERLSVKPPRWTAPCGSLSIGNRWIRFA